jgi:hypothetical protein
MFTVIIKSAAVRERTTQKGNILKIQKMALECGDDFPVVFEQVVDQAHAPGRYGFEPQFRVDRFGGLELNPFEINLTPIK